MREASRTTVGMGEYWIKSSAMVGEVESLAGVTGGTWTIGTRDEFGKEDCKDGAITPAKARRRGYSFVGRS
jgi:hypothetical protein